MCVGGGGGVSCSSTCKLVTVLYQLVYVYICVCWGGGADVHLPVNWSFIVAGIIYAIILCSTQNLQRSIGVNLSVTHSLYVCILQRNTKHTEANKGRLY